MATNLLGPIVADAVDRVASVAAASGYYARVLTHEPKSAPGDGYTFATWIATIDPIARQSGLSVTTARIPMMARTYVSLLTEPQDGIDKDLATVAAQLLSDYTADFGLTGAYVDLLGAYGPPLGAGYGYVALDETKYRVVDIMIPFIAPDVFAQAE